MAAADTRVDIPLIYDYTPGEAFWAKFGTVDAGACRISIDRVRIPSFGSIRAEDETYTLIPRSDVSRYFAAAFATVLSHLGVRVDRTASLSLSIRPLQLSIWSFDGQPDGLKKCRIAYAASLIDSTGQQLFDVYVENEGTTQGNDDEEDSYSELIDQTLHGAIAKLWASQVLFTKTALGKGRIHKSQLGTYGFTADSSTAILPPGSTGSGLASLVIADVPSQQAAAPRPSGLARTETDLQRSGAASTEFTGKRIALGILPFENATGNSSLSSAALDAQGQVVQTLSRAASVSLIEREKLTDILREQALGLSGIMNDSTVVRIGSISGLKAIIAGRLTAAGGFFRLEGRIINVETAAVVATAGVDIPDVNQIAQAGPELAAALLQSLTGEKLPINRNSMAYPSILPLAIPAHAAGADDAWAIELNPAALMKQRQRDAQFFVSFAKTLKGKLTTTDGVRDVRTVQPPFENLGTNVALPLGRRFATGFGIRHQYTFPQLTIDAASTSIKEEETVFTLPLAIGINPSISLGANMRMHILEYQITNPPTPYLSGTALFADVKLGMLFKISPKLRAGATFTSRNITAEAQGKSGVSGQYKDIQWHTPYLVRTGIAMYPRKWFFFFADLEYAKYYNHPKIQPGFHLGAQLTHYGRIINTPHASPYGMLPLWLGYSHEPYNRLTNTQARYVSVGSGYYLNNFYVQWALRCNVEPDDERKIMIGKPDSGLMVADYRLVTPLFLCLGYRF
jgi:hypothetical protein